jgi:phosphate transport system substrate-binding protein
MKTAAAILAATTALLTTPVLAQGIDPSLPNYEPVSGVSGNLVSIGSDTLNNLMTLWSEGFRGFYPNVAVQIQGAGSGTAPPALVEGTAQFGPMSRPMRGTEIEEFEARYGYEPIPMRGAIDGIGVFVHKDNPIECLSLQQVDAIFSSTRRAARMHDHNLGRGRHDR